MPFDPVITQYLDAAPAPRVEVFFGSLAAGTSAITLYRLADGREQVVRGAVRASTAGQFTRIDNEVPFGVPVTYRAEMFSSNGQSLGFTSTATTTLEVGQAWVHNPLDPAGSVPVILERKTARELTRPSFGDVYYPQGRQVGVLLTTGRSGLAGTQLSLVTVTDDDADKFSSMLGAYGRDVVPTLCLRTPSGMKMRLPKPFYAGVLAASEEAFDLQNGGSTVVWSMKADEVSPPAPALFISLLTRADVNAFYASRADVDAYNLTRLDVARNYDISAGSTPALEPVEYPDGSAMYTTGNAVAAPQAGLFLTDGFVESPAGSGLYAIGGGS